MQLTPELLNEFAAGFIRVPPGGEALREKVKDMLVRNIDLIEACVIEGGIGAVPYFDVGATPYFDVTVSATQPRSKEVCWRKEDEDGHMTFQLAGESADLEKELIKGLLAYKELLLAQSEEIETRTPIASGKINSSRNATEVSFMENRKSPGFGIAGFRTPASLAEPMERKNGFKNTRSDLAWGKLRTSHIEANQMEWHFYQDLLFQDSVIEKLSFKDWLRQLRMLSGRRAEDMASALGLSDYSAYENRADYKSLPLSYCNVILDKNLFFLPTESKDSHKVAKSFRIKFLRKMGHSGAEKEDLSNAVKAIVIETAREIALGQTPEPIEGSDRTEIFKIYTDGKGPQHPVIKKAPGAKSQADMRVAQSIAGLEIPEDSQYLHLLPREKEQDHIVAGDETLSISLARSLVFEIAEHATDAREFLQRYQQISKIKGKDIGKHIPAIVYGDNEPRKMDGSSVMKLLSGKDQLNDGHMEAIIRHNAFQFPTDPEDSAQIHPEVLRALKKLWLHEKYVSPYLSAAQAGEAAKITSSGAGQWALRQEAASPEYADWKEYWNKLSADNKGRELLSVGGQKVHSWRDAYDRLLIHKGDIDIVEQDFRQWQKQRPVVSAPAIT